jgi:hypothetical protein
MEAFRRSFARGYGVETDIRDQNGAIVISHDVPSEPCVSLQVFLKEATLNPASERRTLALNVKSDGLADLLNKDLLDYRSLDCFVFDMSVPDMRSYLHSNISVFTRLSDVEPVPAWLDMSQGVWLDAFKHEWYNMETIRDLLSIKKHVCVVSPELHGRPHLPLWASLKAVWHNPNLCLCTDYPDEALMYFSGSF